MVALSKNGCAIEQNTCPSITNAKPTLTKHLIIHPKKVSDAPITTPFFIPLTSSTQFDGKLRNKKNIKYDIGMNATHRADTSYAFFIGSDIGVMTTQHMPFIMEAVEYRMQITIR